MNRTVWRWMLGISLVLLVGLILFTFLLWIFVNVGGVLLIMLTMGNGDFAVGGISLGKFLENFVGSPMFYIYVADLAVLAGSAIMLAVTKKKVNRV